MTPCSLGSALKNACDKVREELFHLARTMDNSPLANLALDQVTFEDGRIRSLGYSSHAVSIMDVMRRGGIGAIEKNGCAGPAPEQKKYLRFTHSAIFAEVKVDEDLGSISVTRIVSAIAGGRILNPKTARSQIMGIGMALEDKLKNKRCFENPSHAHPVEFVIPTGGVRRLLW